MTPPVCQSVSSLWTQAKAEAYGEPVSPERVNTIRKTMRACPLHLQDVFEAGRIYSDERFMSSMPINEPDNTNAAKSLRSGLLRDWLNRAADRTIEWLRVPC